MVMLGKRRIKRSRMMLPSGRRVIRTRSLIPRREIMIRKGKVGLMRIRKYKRVFKRYPSPLRYFNAFRNFQKTFKTLFQKPVRSWETKQTEWSPLRRRTQYTKRKRMIKGFGKRTSWRRPLKTLPGLPQIVQRQNDQRITRDDIIKKLLSQRKRKNQNMVRKHPWTGKNKFGPVGHLGPKLIIDLKPTAALTAILRKIGSSSTRRIIETSIDDFRDKLIEFAEEFIDIYVPEETGRLRKNLKKNFKTGRRVHLNLKMKIYTSRDRILKYAKPVNEMPVTLLAHNPRNAKGNPKSGKSRRTKRAMHDPKAQHHFFTWLYLSLREKAKKLLREMVKQIAGMARRIDPTSIRRYRQSRRGYSLPQKPRTKNKIEKKIINGKHKMYSPGGKMGTAKEATKFMHQVAKDIIEYKKSQTTKKKEQPLTTYEYRDVRGWFVAKGLGRW